MYNLAHSALRGYDIRAPYNVPMGEIQVLRVVLPFSVSSYQRDTITAALPGACLVTPPGSSAMAMCKRRNRCSRTSSPASPPSTKPSHVGSSAPKTGSPPGSPRQIKVDVDIHTTLVNDWESSAEETDE